MGQIQITATTNGVTTDAASNTSFEYEYTEKNKYGIELHTEENHFKFDIFLEVYEDIIHTTDERARRWLKKAYERIDAKYGSLFDLNTEVGRETFERFVRYAHTNSLIAGSELPYEEKTKLRIQSFEEAYGFSVEFSEWLVYEIYLDEKPEDRYLLGVRWQTSDISMEYLLLQIAHPEATEDKLLELLRESIRAGNVTIASSS